MVACARRRRRRRRALKRGEGAIERSRGGPRGVRGARGRVSVGKPSRISQRRTWDNIHTRSPTRYRGAHQRSPIPITITTRRRERRYDAFTRLRGVFHRIQRWEKSDTRRGGDIHGPRLLTRRRNSPRDAPSRPDAAKPSSSSSFNTDRSAAASGLKLLQPDLRP